MARSGLTQEEKEASRIKRRAYMRAFMKRYSKTDKHKKYRREWMRAFRLKQALKK